jgi:hypothetical protein
MSDAGLQARTTRRRPWEEVDHEKVLALASGAYRWQGQGAGKPAPKHLFFLYHD